MGRYNKELFFNSIQIFEHKRHSATPKYRGDIDGLRAIAVLSVVFYHANLSWFSGGYAGVDIFFVISGYLITSIIFRQVQENKFSIVEFYERRARRILPALGFMMLFTWAGAYLIILPSDMTNFALSVLAVTTFSANYYFYFILGDYFASAAEFHPLLHMWSLAVEEQFYLVLPLLALAFKNKNLLKILIPIFVASFVYSEYSLISNPSLAFYHAFPRAWELLAGSILAISNSRYSPKGIYAELLSFLGIAIIIVTIFLFEKSTLFPGKAALLPVIGTVLLIWSGENKSTLVAKILALPPIVFIGLISYSLYLMHWPVMALVRNITGFVELSPKLQFFTIVCSVVLAVFSWWFVERPFRDRKKISNAKVARMALATVIGFVTISVSILAMHGYNFRFKEDIIEIANAANDFNPQREQCFDKWPSNGPCKIGDLEKEPSFAVWGDSHADALVTAISAAAQKLGHGGIFFVHGGCPPLLNIANASVNYTNNCLDHQSKAKTFLEKSKTIKKVILVFRWNYPEAEKQLFRDFEQNNEKPNLFELGLNRTIDFLKNQQLNITIVENIPEIGWDVPSKMLNKERFGLSLPPIPSLKDTKIANSEINEILTELESKRLVEIVSLNDVLCAPSCRIEYQGRPIYRDGHHLAAKNATVLLKDTLAKRLF